MADRWQICYEQLRCLLLRGMVKSQVHQNSEVSYVSIEVLCFTYLDIIPYLLLKVVMSISFRDKLLFLISFEFSSRQMLINITCLIFC